MSKRELQITKYILLGVSILSSHLVIASLIFLDILLTEMGLKRI
ncbi:MAG: hypothetical protein AABY22_10835 [Nanoarchaeota archaeon]